MLRLIARTVVLSSLAASPLVIFSGHAAPTLEPTAVHNTRSAGETPAGGTFLLIGSSLIGIAALNNRLRKNRAV